MESLKFVLIAIGLAMDAFAVSISSGVTIKKMHIRHALRIAAFFGFFQALMPLIGWKLGSFAKDYISAYDHWIAFVLLAIVGGKMIYGAVIPHVHTENDSDPLNLYLLFMLAIATSIDALAVGVTFSLLDISILTPILIIGGITFVMSFAGTYLGNKVGHRVHEHVLEVAGGIILIGIGTKILVEHFVG